MNLIALPAFTDNHRWMLHASPRASVADPGASAPVTPALDARQRVVAAILVTPRHAAACGPRSARSAASGAVPRSMKNDFR
jgi:hypothetical protein